MPDSSFHIAACPAIGTLERIRFERFDGLPSRLGRERLRILFLAQPSGHTIVNIAPSTPPEFQSVASNLMSAAFLDPSKRLQSWRDSHELSSELLSKSRASSVQIGGKASTNYCSSAESTFRSLKAPEASRSARPAASNAIHLGANQNQPDSFHTSALMSLNYQSCPEGSFSFEPLHLHSDCVSRKESESYRDRRSQQA
jgi:hypothetical protein